MFVTFFKIHCRAGHLKSLVILEILGSMLEPQSKKIPGLSLMSANCGTDGVTCVSGDDVLVA